MLVLCLFWLSVGYAKTKTASSSESSKGAHHKGAAFKQKVQVGEYLCSINFHYISSSWLVEERIYCDSNTGNETRSDLKVVDLR